MGYLPKPKKSDVSSVVTGLTAMSVGKFQAILSAVSTAENALIKKSEGLSDEDFEKTYGPLLDKMATFKQEVTGVAEQMSGLSAMVGPLSKRIFEERFFREKREHQKARGMQSEKAKYEAPPIALDNDQKTLMYRISREVIPALIQKWEVLRGEAEHVLGVSLPQMGSTKPEDASRTMTPSTTTEGKKIIDRPLERRPIQDVPSGSAFRPGQSSSEKYEYLRKKIEREGERSLTKEERERALNDPELNQLLSTPHPYGAPGETGELLPPQEASVKPWINFGLLVHQVRMPAAAKSWVNFKEMLVTPEQERQMEGMEPEQKEQFMKQLKRQHTIHQIKQLKHKHATPFETEEWWTDEDLEFAATTKDMMQEYVKALARITWFKEFYEKKPDPRVHKVLEEHRVEMSKLDDMVKDQEMHGTFKDAPRALSELKSSMSRDINSHRSFTKETKSLRDFFNNIYLTSLIPLGERINEMRIKYSAEDDEPYQDPAYAPSRGGKLAPIPEGIMPEKKGDNPLAGMTPEQRRELLQDIYRGQSGGESSETGHGMHIGYASIDEMIFQAATLKYVLDIMAGFKTDIPFKKKYKTYEDEELVRKFLTDIAPKHMTGQSMHCIGPVAPGKEGKEQGHIIDPKTGKSIGHMHMGYFWTFDYEKLKKLASQMGFFQEEIDRLIKGLHLAAFKKGWEPLSFPWVVDDPNTPGKQMEVGIGYMAPEHMPRFSPVDNEEEEPVDKSRSLTEEDVAEVISGGDEAEKAELLDQSQRLENLPSAGDKGPQEAPGTDLGGAPAETFEEVTKPAGGSNLSEEDEGRLKVILDKSDKGEQLTPEDEEFIKAIIK